MWEAFKRLIMLNPLTVFVYTILSKWYFLVMMTGIITTYWVFTGLNEAGVIEATEKILYKAFNETKAVAKHCTKKIVNLREFWDCLSHPPEYSPNETELKLQKGVEKIINLLPENKDNTVTNPYDEEGK